MGNNLNDSKDSLLTLIKEQYQELKHDPRGVVLLHKQTQNNFILKEYTFCSQLHFQNKINQLQQQIKRGTRQYVISPIKIQSKVFSSFCSSSYKIYAIFEYPQVSLREEINARQKENKSFEETQLWSILQSCTNALSELKPLISLNPYQIFINPDGHLKIIHDDLVDQNYRAVLSDQIYYAPQKIKNFNKVDSELSLRKESIFSMGMTLLQAAILSSVQSCYDYVNCNFFQVNMVEMLDSLSQKYSPDFIELLGNIIQTNPNRRASLMEVQKSLDNYWGAEENHYHQQNKKQTEQKLSQTSQNTKKQENIPHSPLNQKCFNTSKVSPIQKQPFIKSKQPFIKSAKKSQRPKEKQVTIPDQMSSFKLQKPRPQEGIPALTTPKNQPSLKEGNLYTDPKLLQMIKQDLQDISKLKQSAFYETSKYTYMYPQTQSILNSIRNFQSEPKVAVHEAIVEAFSSAQPTQPTKSQQTRSNYPNRGQIIPNKVMMKKNNNELVFSVQTYENGRRYEGTTLHGKKHGRGKLMFEDGAFYEGEFRQDKMNGRGILYYSEDFPAYDGEWQNDQFQGYGILYNESPQPLEGQFDFRDMNEVEDYWIKYEGQFNMDNKSGKGTLYLTNGQILEGQFIEDCVSGAGRYKFVNGQILDGIWNQNVLTQIIETQ